MKIKITGRKLELTDALKERVEEKLNKLDKYFGANTEAKVVLHVEKTRQMIEVTIHYSSMIFRAEEATPDMYASIDKVIDVLERQIRKNKTRLEKKLHEKAFIPDTEPTVQVEEEKQFNVVRSKTLPVKPMNVDEAILQMNLLGHSFYIYKDADTNELNIVYKRKSGDYGLLDVE